MIAPKRLYIVQLPDWSLDGDTMEKCLCNFYGIRRTFARLHGGVEVRTFKLSGVVMKLAKWCEIS